MPSRVCIIYENRSFGGMEVHTVALVQALLAHGHSVEIVINGDKNTLEPVLAKHGLMQSVTLARTDFGGILEDRDGTGLLWGQFLTTLRSDILIFPKGVFAAGRLPFLRECRKHFRRIVFIEHLEAPAWNDARARRWFGVFPGLGLWRYRERRYRQACTACVDHIVAVSTGVKQRLVQDWHQPADKITVVRNGIAWREHRHDSARRHQFRARHGIGEGDFVFGMMVRLSRQKAVDVAVRALRLLSAQLPLSKLCLVVAGEGAEEAALRALAGELGLADSVRFIGFVNEPREVLSAYDVILFSSVNEGLPLALLEGMSSGCVPIVTRIGGMPEAVSDARIGWVVEPNDPEALCAAMRTALQTSAEDFEAMRGSALATIQQNFDIAAAHQRILALCEV